MKVSPRLMGGVAVVCASVIAIGSAVAPPRDVAGPANRPTATRVVSHATVELLAAVQRMAPAVVSPAPTAAAATAAPAPQSAASDLIITAWNAVLPWIDYGVNLTDYVLGFIPYGYLIGDQINIVYYSLVRPVANSFVVDLVAPVVNAPLNINSYLNGLAALGSVTVTSLINLGINEFNYFFGWLIPPIPPLPLAAPAAAAELRATSLTEPATPAEAGPFVEKPSTVQPEAFTAAAITDTSGQASAENAEVATETTPAKTDEAEPTDATETATPTPKESTSVSSRTVQAQGEVRKPGSSTDTSADETNVSTDKSAKDDKGDNDDKGDKPGTVKPDKKDATGKKE